MSDELFPNNIYLQASLFTLKMCRYYPVISYHAFPNCSLVSSTEERNAKSDSNNENKIELSWQYGQGDYEEKKEVSGLLQLFFLFAAMS